MIAPPVPAKSYLPDWFRKLPAVDEAVASKSDTGLTIKRCMPFLDAHVDGLDPAAGRHGPARHRATAARGSRPAGTSTRPWSATTALHQVRGNPWGNAAAAQVPQLLDDRDAAGLELPVRRPAEPAERRVRGAGRAWSIPTPTARSIHFPFFATGPDGLLRRSRRASPLVQVIPFRRDAPSSPPRSAPRRPRTARRASASCAARSAETGWYRTSARAKR